MPEALSSTQLDGYLARIGYSGSLHRDLATIAGLVRAHVQAIAFENIDVQLGQPLDTDPQAAFAKLVKRRRGGWCYEHNGVLGAALVALGFDVVRMSAGVMREVRGDAAMGTHLCLLVDGRWLVDAGFGSWLGAPVSLEPGTWQQPPFPVNLRKTDDGLWRVAVGQGNTAMSYDFHPAPANEDELSQLCHWQANDPASPFVQNLTVQRRCGDRFMMMRGKVLSEVGSEGETRRELGSAGELVACLRETFLLDVPEVAELWPAIDERHQALFGDQALPTT